MIGEAVTSKAGTVVTLAFLALIQAAKFLAVDLGLIDRELLGELIGELPGEVRDGAFGSDELLEFGALGEGLFLDLAGLRT